jgi:uncharacterized protein with HEPN domain
MLIIGEAANKIPEEIQEKFNEIDWRGIIGMRNIIVHGYFKINPDIIWETVQTKIPELKRMISKAFFG